MRQLTADALFDYADQHARAAEAANKGTVYPTIRAAAKHFKATQQAVEETCDDYTGPGYMGIIAGFRTGAGIGSFSGGDRQIEAYKDAT